MFQIEPWMIRTTLVVGALFLFDGVLFGLHVWLQRRKPLESFPRIKADIL